MSVPIIYKNTLYIAKKHTFKTTLANDTSITCNVMTIVNGNIGIGTTYPRQLLDIQGGNVIMSGNVGIGTTIPRQLLDVQGSNVISSGNVGIGTTIPLYNLHINGTISAINYNNIPVAYNNILNVETFKTLTAGTTRTLNWTVPTSFTKYITFEMWGGGGAGGPGRQQAGPIIYYGDGGEGGDYTKITFPFTIFSGINTLTLTIGAGGVGRNNFVGIAGQNTNITWGGAYTIQAFGGQGGSMRNTAGTAYNFLQKTYTNQDKYDVIIPGGYGGVFSPSLKNGINNSITTGIIRNYNGTGGGGSGSDYAGDILNGIYDGSKGGPGGSNYTIPGNNNLPGLNYYSSIETAIYGGTYTYIFGGQGGGGGGTAGGDGKTGGYPGGGGGGSRGFALGITNSGGSGGDGLIRITWY